MSEENEQGELSRWRVQLLATVELAGYTKEEALYAAIKAVQRASRELLQPYSIEKLSPIMGLEKKAKTAREKEQWREEHKAQIYADDGTLPSNSKGFEPNPEVKAKWVKELVEQVASEVASKLSVVERAQPIPLREGE